MAELLLELLSEEIPARMQARAAADLKRLVGGGLEEAGLAYTRLDCLVTPRRLALVVDGLPLAQPDDTEERRGPRADAPAKAIQGFLGSVGLGLDQVERRRTDKGEFLFAVIKKKAAKTADVLPRLVYEAIIGMNWPKSMRWGSNRFPWIRPLHTILAIYEETPLRGVLRLGRGGEAPTKAGFASTEGMLSQIGDEFFENHITFSNATRGHRFLASRPFTVKNFADYAAKLRKAKVMLDPSERRRAILEGATRLALAEGLTVKPDEELLEEVTGLVEFPVPLIGKIDPAYMDLPPELLTTAMRHHLKFFACLSKDGRLAPRFIVVANIEAADGGKAIVAGNERVLRARLADAKFFWDQDRKTSLSSRAPRLAGIVFHAMLGSLDRKADRVQALAVEIAKYIPGADKDRVRSAARLAKADLTTGMVVEFPELQGIMGRYYALADGEHAEVANAIAEHYAPHGPHDGCPTAAVSVAVAIADKIDTLVGFFMIGETPTGSKDPFALRRAALGVIRLIVENKLRIKLKTVFEVAAQLYGPVVIRYGPAPAPGKEEPPVSPEKTSSHLLSFFADRLKVVLKDKRVRHDLIDSVFALGGDDDLVRLLARVEALQDFLATEDGSNLLTAYKRAANILKIEEERDRTSYAGSANAALFRKNEEKDLSGRLGESGPEIAAAIEAERFADAMAALARLRRPVDAFFDHVTVNCDDKALRENRLRLLSGIRSALNGVADFSAVEG